MYFLLLLTSALALGTVYSERGGSCVTPNGEKATCVAALSCKVIFDAASAGNITAVEFAQKSQCGHDGEPLVCCGSLAYPIPGPQEAATEIDKQKTKERILSSLYTNALPDRSVCGLEREEGRIIGGTIAELDEFPWMAALEYKSTFSGKNVGIKCGGSIINNRYVLTAAHCLKEKEFKLIGVRLGEWNTTTDPDCQQQPGTSAEHCADNVKRVKIKEEIPHTFYTKATDNNDIALLKLEEDITYSDYIRPICLPPPELPNPDVGTRLIISGWGATEKGTLSDVKLKVDVPLISNGICSDMFRGKKVNANQLCAGSEPGRDSCQGDSGGPLMRTYEDYTQQPQWYQEGIVSYGIGCGRVGYPAIYTRVSRYMSWILNNIEED